MVAELRCVGKHGEEYKLSEEACMFAHFFLGPSYEQYLGRGVWINQPYVVKLYGTREYFYNIMNAHEKLERFGACSEFVAALVTAHGEYLIVEKFVSGRNLSLLSQDIAYDMITMFTSRMRTQYPEFMCPERSENFVLMESGDIKIVDLAELRF